MSAVIYHDDEDNSTLSSSSSFKSKQQQVVEPILSPNKLKYKKKEWSSGLFSSGELSVKTNSKSETKYFVIQNNVEYDDEDDEESQHQNVDYDDSQDSDSDNFTETDKFFTPKLQSQKELNCKIYPARDFNETCYTCCCLPCANADALKYVKNNQSSWWCTCCISCCFPTIMSTIVRNITRKLYGIQQGNACTDCCVGTFCSCCSSAQVLREIRCRGPPKPIQMI
ncbi:predicted protein [Naegleria gruberi]|uniref:Predicted protein n=1 Tax=Naegleria gruberi TaxID=5762 RepID=D2VXD2_NAEGR|nr:uncharacterized protein NAEGRDRAFT_73704 [Naegleria gruberi]EFC38487.1 predicted protein [Naegleria gruberi]|eukprot:XP_002671231.1 predicted protein [Naegleria gruberi strain NEG-M]